MVPRLLCTFVAHITFLHVFFLPPPFILSLSLLLSLSLSLSLFLSLPLYLCPLFLSVVARHMSPDALYQIFSSWSILLFHTISFHSSYKIHQLFTDYLLRLPSSELLEKHLFRSRANRRLVDKLKASRGVVWQLAISNDQHICRSKADIRSLLSIFWRSRWVFGCQFDAAGQGSSIAWHLKILRNLAWFFVQSAWVAYLVCWWFTHTGATCLPEMMEKNRQAD